jgi:cyclophilin family peptidyl-prolyl cis-trans isomerase
MHKHFSFLVCCGWFAALPLVGWAQEEKKSEAPPPAATDKPADPAAPPAAEAKGPAAQKFTATYDQWKEIIKKLRSLRMKYQTAEEKEAESLRAEWDAAIIEADKMLPELRASAVAAYEEAPNLDSTIARFLKKLLDDDIAQDQYEQAQKLADVLIKHESEYKDVYSQAGIAAFVLADYDNAEKYFAEADTAGVLSVVAQKYKALIPDYKEYWKAEQAIREKEAAANDLPRVKLETTKGDIVIELFENEAPQTVGNFIHLVGEKKFYDGTVFHRVLPGFMAQGGDPEGTGRGGPGYTIPCECYKPEARKHFRGTLSMAHAGRDTGGSQFFLTFVPTDHLNGKHTAFGRVIEGMDVLARLQRIDPEMPNSNLTPDKIIKAEVLRKRDHEYVPTKVN